MHKKIMIILGVMVLLLYGYSYTEVGFSVSSIKESNLLNSIEETNQLLLSDSYKGLYVVIYQDQRNITIYEFAQNPLTKRYSLITQRNINMDHETLYHGIARTSIYEIDYKVELENKLIVFESSNIRDDVMVRVAWDVGVVILIILGSVYYRKYKNR